MKSFFPLEQLLHISKESKVAGPEYVGYVSMKLNTETASANLKRIADTLKINTAFF